MHLPASHWTMLAALHDVRKVQYNGFLEDFGVKRCKAVQRYGLQETCVKHVDLCLESPWKGIKRFSFSHERREIRMQLLIHSVYC